MNEGPPAVLPLEERAATLPFPPSLPSVSVRDVLIGVPIVWGFVVGVNLMVLIGLVVVYLVNDGASFLEPPVPLMLGTSFLCLLWANAVACFFVCRKYGLPLVRGFALSRVDRKTVRRCVLTGIVTAVGAAVLMGLLARGDSLIAEVASTSSGLLLFSAFALLAPPFEEVYYRGFLFPAFRNSVGPRWAVAIVTLWFGLVHSVQLAGDWAGIPIILVMGGIWTVQRHRSDSLTPSIITHFTYNASLCVLGALEVLLEGIA